MDWLEELVRTRGLRQDQEGRGRLRWVYMREEVRLPGRNCSVALQSGSLQNQLNRPLRWWEMMLLSSQRPQALQLATILPQFLDVERRRLDLLRNVLVLCIWVVAAAS
jgi:hypothetical protein